MKPLCIFATVVCFLDLRVRRRRRSRQRSLLPLSATVTSFRYLADPPLLELCGDSTSSSPRPSFQLQRDVPPALVVPAGIVAQRRKSFSDHASAAAPHRAPFMPEVPIDIVTSAGYVKSIVEKNASAGEGAAPAHTPQSAPHRRFSMTKGGAVELGHPSANEPSTILAPYPGFQPAVAQAPSPAHHFDILLSPAAEASGEALFSTVSQVNAKLLVLSLSFCNATAC